MRLKAASFQNVSFEVRLARAGDRSVGSCVAQRRGSDYLVFNKSFKAKRIFGVEAGEFGSDVSLYCAINYFYR